MKIASRLLFVSLVTSLAVNLVFGQYGSILTVRASPDLFQGDLVLTGNNVTVIEGQFDINGSIIVEDNATLILGNAIVAFTQTDHHRARNLEREISKQFRELGPEPFWVWGRAGLPWFLTGKVGWESTPAPEFKHILSLFWLKKDISGCCKWG